VERVIIEDGSESSKVRNAWPRCLRIAPFLTSVQARVAYVVMNSNVSLKKALGMQFSDARRLECPQLGLPSTSTCLASSSVYCISSRHSQQRCLCSHSRMRLRVDG
jgi:hypothetical protein